MSQKPKRFSSELFVGARLGAVRTEAGITLEQAARDTHIRVQKLREIEVDDFSGFAHPTYARLFLLDYAAYLGVEADEIRPLLPDQTKAASAGFQYLDVLGGAAGHPSGASRSSRRRIGIAGVLVTLVLVTLILIGAIYFWSTLRKIERISIRTSEAPVAESSATPAESPLPSPTPAEPPLAEPPASLWEVAPPESEPPLLSPEAPPAL